MDYNKVLKATTNSRISKYLAVDPVIIKEYLKNVMTTKPTLVNMIVTVLHAIAVGILYKLYKDADADKKRLEKQEFEIDDQGDIEKDLNQDDIIG